MCVCVFVRILNERGPAWLRSRRQIYVAENENGYARNSLHAGRTGTRLNIGRPQTRWSEGALFAKRILEISSASRRNNNARTIGTMYSEIEKEVSLAVPATNIFSVFRGVSVASQSPGALLDSIPLVTSAVGL